MIRIYKVYFNFWFVYIVFVVVGYLGGNMMFKRIQYYITKNWRKAMLLSLFIFFSSALILTMSATQNISEYMMQRVKQNFGAQVHLTWNIQKDETGESVKDLPMLEAKYIDKLAADERVRVVDWSETIMIMAEDLVQIVDEKSDQGTDLSFSLRGHSFWLNGVAYPDYFLVHDNDLSVMDGRAFTQEEINAGANVVIINETVAQQSKKHVGDKIILKQQITTPAHELPIEELINELRAGGTGAKVLVEQAVEVEIIGIYRPQLLTIDAVTSQSQDQQASFRMSNELQQNMIFIPNPHVEQMLQFEESEKLRLGKNVIPQNYYRLPSFILKSPDDVEQFVLDYQEILPEAYRLASSFADYQRVAEPLIQISTITQRFVMITVLIYLIILIALCWNYIRDRRKESAVLLALGEKRQNIVLQITTEITLLASVGIVIAFVLSSLIGPTIMADIVTKKYTESIPTMGYGLIIAQSGISGHEINDMAQNAFSISDLITVLMLILVTVLVVTIMNIIYVYRLSPREILIE